MAVARSFLVLLLLTTAVAAFAHTVDEGRTFDVTTIDNVPRKVLNGGSDGELHC